MNNLDEYKAAYFGSYSDEECIALISDDSDVIKLQLQIALGVAMDFPGRMVNKHENHRINLQRALISKIDDRVFLSDVLRDFIIRPCDDGQIPVPDADITTRLLLDAGADPYARKVSENYLSPGFEFIHRRDLQQTTFDLAATCYNYPDHPIMKELLHEAETTFRFTKKWLLHLIFTRISALDKTNTDSQNDISAQIMSHEFIETTLFLADELIKSGITTTELTILLSEEISSYTREVSEYHLMLYRWTESFVLQRIYDRDAEKLEFYTWLAKACLILSPLIIPLFIAAVIGIIYLVTKQSMDVKIKDISIHKFMRNYLNNENEFSKIYRDHAFNLPVIDTKSGPALRPVIVFNTDTLEKKLASDHISIFSKIFNGNSSMVLGPDSPEIDGDVRVYVV